MKLSARLLVVGQPPPLAFSREISCTRARRQGHVDSMSNSGAAAALFLRASAPLQNKWEIDMANQQGGDQSSNQDRSKQEKNSDQNKGQQANQNTQGQQGKQNAGNDQSANKNQGTQTDRQTQAGSQGQGTQQNRGQQSDSIDKNTLPGQKTSSQRQ